MTRFLALTLVFFALACVPSGPKSVGFDAAPEGISATTLTTEMIVAQPLDAAPPEPLAEVEAAEAEPQALQPLSDEVATDTAPAPEVPTPEELAPAESKPPSSPEEAACVKKGGLWIHAGKSIAYTCVRITRDSGKQCRKGSECQGSCLARSMTCAPYDPLFGCNEILQDDGSRVTLCID